MKLFLDRFPLHAEKIFRAENKRDTQVVLSCSETYERLFPDRYKNKYSAISVSRGLFFDEAPWILTREDIRFYENYKGIFINLLSRFQVTLDCFSADEMAVHYLRLVNFWKYKIVELKPDAVFAYYIPHDPSSFALYLVSKKEKVPYIFLESIYFGNGIMFFSCALSHRTLLSYGSNVFGHGVNEVLLNYVKGVKQSDYSSVPIQYIEWWKKSTQSLQMHWFQIMRCLFPFSISALLRGKVKEIYQIERMRTCDSWAKVNRRVWRDDRSQIKGYWQSVFLEWRQKRRLARMSANYRKMCVKLEELGNYIYFAAHLEPEGSTLPTALAYFHFFPLLKMISEHLPEGFYIAYKENPLQFSYLSEHDGQYKSEWYYEELKLLGNIKFVEETVPSWQLLDHSIGAATIVGTVAIEAAFRGKYCITCGSNYYDNLDGVRRIYEAKDVKEAIDIMISGKKPNPMIEQLGLHQNSYAYQCISSPTDKDEECISEAFFDALESFNLQDDRKWKI